MLRRMFLVGAVTAALVAAACGGGDDDNDQSSPTADASATRSANTPTAPTVSAATPASSPASPNAPTLAPAQPTQPPPLPNTPAPIPTSTTAPPPSPPPTQPPPPPANTTLALTAASVRFAPGSLSAPAGNVSINLNNADAGISHNVHVFAGASASGASIGATSIASGPVQQTLDLGQLAPGAYFFRCDVHPSQMTGSLTVS